MREELLHIEYISTIVNCISQVGATEAELLQLKTNINKYFNIVTKDTALSRFPALKSQLADGFNKAEFTAEGSLSKLNDLENIIFKISHINDIIKKINEINDKELYDKLNIDQYKIQFAYASEKLDIKSVYTFWQEACNFEQLLKKTESTHKIETQKRNKIKSFITQDHALFQQFPLVYKELTDIIEIGASGVLNPDFILAGYPTIKINLAKISEYSIFFSRLTKDYLGILDVSDLTMIHAVRSSINLSGLHTNFVRINSIATECKNRINLLDNLRKQFYSLKNEVIEKRGDLSDNHISFIQNELKIINEILHDNPGKDFQKAGAKINTIKDILKKEFKSADVRNTDSLYIRQSIAKYETRIWEEDLTKLFTELNHYIAGTSKFKKEDFESAISNFTKNKTIAIEKTKTQFELFLIKNRTYRNILEKIINTKSSKSELEQLINEMNNFKLAKEIFYRFIK